MIEYRARYQPKAGGPAKLTDGFATERAAEVVAAALRQNPAIGQVEVVAVCPPAELSAPEPAEQLPQLLDVKSLARLLGVTVRTVYRLVQMGKLPPPLAVGVRTLRWRQEDLQPALACQHAQEGP